jgi:hypothetical protein
MIPLAKRRIAMKETLVNIQIQLRRTAILAVVGLGLITVMATTEEPIEIARPVGASATATFTLAEGQQSKQVKLTLNPAYTHYGVAQILMTGTVTKDASADGDLSTLFWKVSLLEQPEIISNITTYETAKDNVIGLRQVLYFCGGKLSQENNNVVCIPDCVRDESCVLTLNLTRQVSDENASNPLPAVSVELNVMAVSMDSVMTSQKNYCEFGDVAACPTSDTETHNIEVEVLP